MFFLERHHLVGKGLHRECYRHPEDENLCIKVVVAGGDEETRREKKYYRHLSRRGVSWDMIPRYHGDIETNLGTGSVFDLIVDDDGNVSKTLQHYLSSNEELEEHVEGLSNGLRSLKSYLLRQRIITMTLKPKNIACKKIRPGGFRLFLVDNIGNSDFIPICNYSKYFAWKKIRRKWRYFEDRMLATHRENTALLRVLEGARR